MTQTYAFYTSCNTRNSSRDCKAYGALLYQIACQTCSRGAIVLRTALNLTFCDKMSPDVALASILKLARAGLFAVSYWRSLLKLALLLHDVLLACFK